MNFKKIQYDSEAVRKSLKKGKMDPNCAAHLLKKEISDSNVINFSIMIVNANMLVKQNLPFGKDALNIHLQRLIAHGLMSVIIFLSYC